MRTIAYRNAKPAWALALLLALCLALVPAAQAEEIARADVRSAAGTWVRHVTAEARPDAVVERMEPYEMDGETVAYIAHLAGGGFALCGADDLVLPVYYYSPRGLYDPQNPNYQYILWEIGTRLNGLRRGLEAGGSDVPQAQDELSERAEYWQDLIASRAPARGEAPQGSLAEPNSMTLDLTSEWSQGSAIPTSPRFNTFNAMCPVLTPDVTPTADERAIVGCTATALAQIMYYWRWPNTGEGSESVNYPYWRRLDWAETPLTADPGIASGWPWAGRLEWTAASGGRLRMNGYWDQSLYDVAQIIDEDPAFQSALAALWGTLSPEMDTYFANFGAETYNWSVMQDTQAAPGTGSHTAMAELSYHAGVASGMNYGIRESGASAGTTLQDHFRYDPDAAYAARNIDMMIDEIQWLRPLLFTGWDDDGEGHAWVVFGYDRSTDQFRMNMGWGGDDDGWYTCDDVSLPHGFTLNQAHLTWVAPEGVVKFVGDTNPGDGTPNDPYKSIDEAVVMAPSGAKLIFKAGSVNSIVGDTLVINRPFTLEGRDVVIR